MATERAGDGDAIGGAARPEGDGLLDYLHTLYRVAHAPGASHWCTPGHNRGRALADLGKAPVVALPVTPRGRREAV